jgi:hypothetical protein
LAIFIYQKKNSDSSFANGVGIDCGQDTLQLLGQSFQNKKSCCSFVKAATSVAFGFQYIRQDKFLFNHIFECFGYFFIFA